MSRILVVDDEPDERFLLRRMFEREGYEVLDACDGAAALAIVRESPPDLILTDMMMPVMDGAELIRRLRERPRHGGHSDPGFDRRPGLASADVVCRPWSLTTPLPLAQPRRLTAGSAASRKDVTR